MTTDTDTLVARLRNERPWVLCSFDKTLDEAADRIEALEAEAERWKSRGDNHWETMRCIYRIATEEGDIQAVIQHIKDAGSGYTERPEETLRRYQTELATALTQLTEARAGEDALAERLHPFAFLDASDPSDSTQKAWEQIHRDRVQDWIDFEEIDAARAALASHDKRKEGRP